MFPDARNSLRQWSDSADTKIPIPVAITLHNFIPPSVPSTKRPSSITKSASYSDDIYHTDSNESDESSVGSPSKGRGIMWLNRQPQHNNNLLPRVNLEITAIKQDQLDKEENGEGIDTNDIVQKTTIVYTEQSPQVRSVHPSWEHLDERICIDNHSEWWNQNDLYKSMKVKLWIVPEPAQSEEEKEVEQPVPMEEKCLLETYLHPSFLERIDLGSASAKKGEDADDGSSLPPALPPNAMLVHFSDGSIRCPPNIYQVLWEKFGHTYGILEAPPVEDFDRFEDDVFATLDHVKQTPQRPRCRSITSLLDQDNDSINQNGPDDIDNDNDGTPNNLESQDDEQPPSHPQHEQDSNPMTPPRRPVTTSKQQYQKDDDDFVFRCCEQDIIEEEKRREKLDLLRLIAEEERGLEEDLDCLQTEQRTLISLVEEIQGVERDIDRLKTELNKQSLKWEREEFLKEAQAIKLFRDLRDIYPITSDFKATHGEIAVALTISGENESYFIRGLQLPGDIYTTTVVEEEVNTSLGYCAHLVFMVAKYLTIQLRHRIFCNGSRSSIEQDGVGVFPLFLGRLEARMLEREQVDRGARLLGANVDCIMMHLDLMPSSEFVSSPAYEIHILAKLRSVLDFVAEGKIAP